MGSGFKVINVKKKKQKKGQIEVNKNKKKVKVKKNGEVRIPCPLQKRGKFFVEGQDLSL